MHCHDYQRHIAPLKREKIILKLTNFLYYIALI